jgi:hypothetical protein
MEMLAVVPFDSVNFLLDHSLDSLGLNLHGVGLVKRRWRLRLLQILGKLILQQEYLREGMLPYNMLLAITGTELISFLFRSELKSFSADHVHEGYLDLLRTVLTVVHHQLEGWEIDVQVDILLVLALLQKQDTLGHELAVMQRLRVVAYNAFLFARWTMLQIGFGFCSRACRAHNQRVKADYFGRFAMQLMRNHTVQVAFDLVHPDVSLTNR